ncbi:ArsB/NhaD family transporter [Geosporobacter ferrireducens]|uniref:Dicarboxylate carrier MatC N-terminal domain-containing protein n=1 Tax=Geosporobacter ferrireducens TaxID=1424294 RepID=A0A1D8GG01_9FIRM|nr:SLC13 family permease [Geosporobacter ferrireducens]AOT69805.1 hypothetical protein Gferi_09570 [Geosporobacter ferrireducens]
MNILLLCLVVIIGVIVLGQKTKINIGLWALAAAYIFGTFVLKISPSDLINAWPTKIFVLLFSVTFFYSFAVTNGTLEKMALVAVYSSRKIPWAIPIVLYILGFVISGIGAGDAATVMLIPIAMSIAKITGMNYFLAAIATLSGVSPGGFSPISTIGVFIRGLMEDVGGYSPELADAFGTRAMFQAILLFFVVFAIAYIVFKGYKIQVPDLVKPEPFDNKQRVTLMIIACFVLVLVLPSLLDALVPGVPFIMLMKKNINVAFIAFIGSIAALLLKVGDEKKAFARVPWHVLTLLSGMGMLISVATKSGAVELLSNYVSNNVSFVMVPIMLSIFAGILSLFVSGFIVNMTFFSLVPGLALALGYDPGLLFATIAVGGLATSVSPFSSSGGLVIASVEDEEKSNMMFKYLLTMPFINITIYIILIQLGI